MWNHATWVGGGGLGKNKELTGRGEDVVMDG